MMHHHTKFGNKMFGCSERMVRISQTFINMLNHHCDLDLDWSNHLFFFFLSFFFHETFLLMMMYHQTICGCKRISSLEDKVEIVIFWFYIYIYICSRCDHYPEDRKPIFLHDTLAHNNTPQYQVWLQKVERFRRYHSDKIGTHGQTHRHSSLSTKTTPPPPPHPLEKKSLMGMWTHKNEQHKKWNKQKKK